MGGIYSVSLSTGDETVEVCMNTVIVITHPGDGRPSLEHLSLPSSSVVTCQVCHATIDISDKREQHVVKCNECSEGRF